MEAYVIRAFIRQLAVNLLRPVLSLSKTNEGLVAVTLHNILEENEEWFDQFISTIVSTYGFVDPKIDLSKPLAAEGLKVLLTFDDGFRSNRIIAEKILDKYGVKGVFFLTEGFIGLSPQDAVTFSDRRFYPNSKLNITDPLRYAAMSWDEVRWLQENNHVIGAHTATHPMLSEIKDEKELTDEIIGSADRMGERLGIRIDCFAYPFGTLNAVSSTVSQLVAQRFKLAYSNIRGSINASPSRAFLYRQNIVPVNDSIWIAKAIIEGKLDWRYWRDRQKAHIQF